MITSPHPWNQQLEAWFALIHEAQQGPMGAEPRQNVLQSDPGFASIVNRRDWNAIGAVCHHPSLVAGSYPNLPSQNYWQIIFVR